MITPEGLASAPIDYFDSSLLSWIGEEWISVNQVVGQTLGAMMTSSFREGGIHQCGDLLLFSRVRALVEQGVLDKKGRLWGAKFQVRRAG